LENNPHALISDAIIKHHVLFNGNSADKEIQDLEYCLDEVVYVRLKFFEF